MKLTKKKIKQIEKRELNKKDKIWSSEVKDKCHNMCVICGDTERLNAHHIIPREFRETRWLLENGVALCPKHHKWGLFSAHRNPYWFVNMLLEVGYNNSVLREWTKILSKKEFETDEGICY
jgi:hypothetical protein